MADALDLGSNVPDVQVQVLLPVPKATDWVNPNRSPFAWFIDLEPRKCAAFAVLRCAEARKRCSECAKRGSKSCCPYQRSPIGLIPIGLLLSDELTQKLANAQHLQFCAALKWGRDVHGAQNEVLSPVAKAKKSNRAAPDCLSFILTSGR